MASGPKKACVSLCCHSVESEPPREAKVGKPMKQSQTGGNTIQSPEPRDGEPTEFWAAGKLEGDPRQTPEMGSLGPSWHIFLCDGKLGQLCVMEDPLDGPLNK